VLVLLVLILLLLCWSMRLYAVAQRPAAVLAAPLLKRLCSLSTSSRHLLRLPVLVLLVLAIWCRAPQHAA
jgi:hypothetical protein